MRTQSLLEQEQGYLHQSLSGHATACLWRTLWIGKRKRLFCTNNKCRSLLNLSITCLCKNGLFLYPSAILLKSNAVLSIVFPLITFFCYRFSYFTYYFSLSYYRQSFSLLVQNLPKHILLYPLFRLEQIGGMTFILKNFPNHTVMKRYGMSRMLRVLSEAYA